MYQAICKVPFSDVRRIPSRRLTGPGHQDENQETQLVHGEKVFVHRIENEWAYIEAVEQQKWYADEGWKGYRGWVERAHLLEEEPVTVRRRMIEDAANYLGLPYLWGGRNPNGVDCSGFVNLLYRKEGMQIPRDACDQYRLSRKIAAGQLQIADLVFLAKEATPQKIYHVMIYGGEDNIIESTMISQTNRKITFEERFGIPLKQFKEGHPYKGDFVYFGTLF